MRGSDSAEIFKQCRKCPECSHCSGLWAVTWWFQLPVSQLCLKNAIFQIWQRHGPSPEFTALWRRASWTRWRWTGWCTGTLQGIAICLIRFCPRTNHQSYSYLHLLNLLPCSLDHNLLLKYSLQSSHASGAVDRQWRSIDEKERARVCEGRDQVWQGGGLQKDDGQVCQLFQKSMQLSTQKKRIWDTFATTLNLPFSSVTWSWSCTTWSTSPVSMVRKALLRTSSSISREEENLKWVSTINFYIKEL